MKPINVDLVFVIDASHSMQPCFDQLRNNLNEVLRPMQGQIAKIRFGLVVQSVGVQSGVAVYNHSFLCGSSHEDLKKLYQRGPNDPDPRNEFFTDDPDHFSNALATVKPQGNEDMLVALDIALDFPFGPLSNTKRVVALFSDEPFEGGISTDTYNSKLPEIIQKIYDRHIMLFCAIPDSEAIQTLAGADRSEIEIVDGGDGLSSVDFRQLLTQMGKSISVSSLQAVGEPPYKRALFGQDAWDSNRTISAQNRDVILAEGEAATLDTSMPLENIHVQLNWTRAIDLDLHAFYRCRNGEHRHVSFRSKQENDVWLDQDAGIDDKGGQNEENIVVNKLDNIEGILFATHIYGDGARFCDYDGRVVVETSNGDKFTVPLSAQKTGRWCVIAQIDNQLRDKPKVINVNRVFDEEPSLDAFS